MYCVQYSVTFDIDRVCVYVFVCVQALLYVYFLKCLLPARDACLGPSVWITHWTELYFKDIGTWNPQ